MLSAVQRILPVKGLDEWTFPLLGLTPSEAYTGTPNYQHPVRVDIMDWCRDEKQVFLFIFRSKWCSWFKPFKTNCLEENKGTVDKNGLVCDRMTSKGNESTVHQCLKERLGLLRLQSKPNKQQAYWSTPVGVCLWMSWLWMHSFPSQTSKRINTREPWPSTEALQEEFSRVGCWENAIGIDHCLKIYEDTPTKTCQTWTLDNPSSQVQNEEAS